MRPGRRKYGKSRFKWNSPVQSNVVRNLRRGWNGVAVEVETLVLEVGCELEKFNRRRKAPTASGQARSERVKEKNNKLKDV